MHSRYWKFNSFKHLAYSESCGVELVWKFNKSLAQEFLKLVQFILRYWFLDYFSDLLGIDFSNNWCFNCIYIARFPFRPSKHFNWTKHFTSLNISILLIVSQHKKYVLRILALELYFFFILVDWVLRFSHFASDKYIDIRFLIINLNELFFGNQVSISDLRYNLIWLRLTSFFAAGARRCII